MIAAALAWLDCHVLDHHPETATKVGQNQRLICTRCYRLGRTLV